MLNMDFSRRRCIDTAAAPWQPSPMAGVWRKPLAREDAERAMLAVHHDGRATVAEGNREAMERHVEAMHEYGLWATVEKAPR